MAGISTDGLEIDYTMSGHVYYFELDGEILVDDNKGIRREDWEFQLVGLVKECELDVNDGRGLHAFVHKLKREGKLESH